MFTKSIILSLVLLSILGVGLVMISSSFNYDNRELTHLS